MSCHSESPICPCCKVQFCNNGSTVGKFKIFECDNCGAQLYYPDNKGWDVNHWEYHCSDGMHPSFWKTVTLSPQWVEWNRIGHIAGFDTAESEECNSLSPDHFQAFLDFVCRARLEEDKRKRQSSYVML